MGKGKNPRKRRDPEKDASARGEGEPQRQTQERVELIPPARRPPTAVGAETPPLPPREPPRSHRAPVPERDRPVLFQLLQGLRNAVGAMLDIADAAAEAITKGLQRRA
jgi:hypothetical protein